METTVVVGSSIGGVRTAQSLRLEGYDGDIVLVGQETELPYDKPPLSKSFLAGSLEESSLCVLSQAQADEAGIRLVLGHAATGVDIARNVLHLDAQDDLRFDHLVIATGTSARPSPWGQRSGVHLLRTLEDARLLRADLVKGGPLAVIGGGFIGAEVASTARTLGVDVTIIDPLPVPMSRVFDAEIGRLFTDLHSRHGVTTIFGFGVEAIDGEEGSFTLRLTNGQTVDAATVLVGIGAVPNDAWLASSGLLVDDGLVLDEYCRAVNTLHIYGVGDVARWHHQTYGEDTRIEHWTNAVEQAACVAYNITHRESPRAYTPVEYVWSDQYDWKIQVVGRVGGNADHVVVEHPESHDRFAALYTGDGNTLAGAAIVNWPKALVECRRGMQTGITMGDLREKLGPLAGSPPRTTI